MNALVQALKFGVKRRPTNLYNFTGLLDFGVKRRPFLIRSEKIVLETNTNI